MTGRQRDFAALLTGAKLAACHADSCCRPGLYQSVTLATEDGSSGRLVACGASPRVTPFLTVTGGSGRAPAARITAVRFEPPGEPFPQRVLVEIENADAMLIEAVADEPDETGSAQIAVSAEQPVPTPVEQLIDEGYLPPAARAEAAANIIAPLGDTLALRVVCALGLRAETATELAAVLDPAPAVGLIEQAFERLATAGLIQPRGDDAARYATTPAARSLAAAALGLTVPRA